MTEPDASPFHARMLAEARTLRAAAENAWLPAVRQQLMSRVIEYENAAVGPEGPGHRPQDPRPGPGEVTSRSET